MDEPQIPTNETSEGEKRDIEEVLESAFTSDQLNKPMEVDNEASTSGGAETVPSELFESNAGNTSELKPEDEEAGHDTSVANETLNEVNETIEQINFEKNQESIDETLNYTEKSINISQIDMEHQQDDSNDAFNALKRDETDALHEDTIKEELKEKSEETPMETDEPTSPKESSTSENIEESNENIQSVPLETLEQTKTADKSTGDDDVQESTNQTENDSENVEMEEPNQKSPEGESSEITEDRRPSEDMDESVQSPTESTEKQPEEEEETETTNEGEGVDENVCLLGDAEEERELTDADKERVVQPQEISEEEESMEPTIEKDQSEVQQTDEIMEIDDGEASGEPEIEKDAGEPVQDEQEEEQEEPSIDHTVPLKENEIREIAESEQTEETCLNCENITKCQYKLLEDSGEIKYLCSYNCIKDHREDNPDKYSLTQKKVYIYEIPPAENSCSKCGELKSCKYHYRVTVSTVITKEPPQPVDVPEGEEPPAPQEPITETVQSTENKYLCDDNCLQETIGGNTEKFIVKEVQRRSTRVRETTKRFKPQEAEPEIPKIVARSDAEVEQARIDRDESFVRRCMQCCSLINFNTKTIQWEALDFCNEKCLGQYQNLIGATCVQCNEVVSLASIGKLCVRFGFELKQFCTTKCLDEFKKSLKQCALCQHDLSNEENVVLAQVGEKKIYRDFCNQQCLNKYESIMNPTKKKQPPHVCSVCNNKKPVKIEVFIDGGIHRLCSNPCLSAFKFVNNVAPDQCDMCEKYFERKSADAHTIYNGTESKIFCSQICQNLFICKFREIWQCNWCKVSKYNFDMIQCDFGNIRMCSLNCLSLSEVSLNALSQKRSKCAHCKLLKQPQYHLTMSDASIRQFCTYQCALGFQGQFRNADFSDVVPAGTAKRIKPSMAAIEQAKKATVPVIARVQSLSSGGRRMRGPYNPIVNRPRSPIPVPELTVQLERLSDLPPRVKIHGTGNQSSWTPIPTTGRAATPTKVEHKTQVVTIPPLPTQVSNKSTMCKAITLNKAISAVPNTAEAECQTEDFLEKTLILPVPIPVYLPQPMYMYNMPTPIPVPIPIPIPVPVFIPTTRNSANGIMKEIKKIQDKMPTDPYEAELLMMAEMVAGDRKREQTDSDSDEDNDMEYGDGMENNSSFNEDLVQMAFKMASGNDFDEPPVDLENEMTANTISQNAHGYDEMDPQALHHHQLLLLHQQQQRAADMQRNRKRMPAPVKNQNNARNNTPNKRIKREMEVMQPEMPREPAEKPDANMCLKYTFGVNAWKQWVATKNADLEKSSIRRKPIKSEILQLTADELNYSLCMFVKEVRKPNGSEYAPDTIYYLVLGIQQYLYENGRIDNIFTDRYYEQFTDCLDEVAKKFSVLYNDSQYIVTRVEEEHLWECKQLGAHSPHVLLSTLMFFNTKHFNLVTVDEHMELSFSHIMKHWKRNPNQPGAAKMPGSRNVLLRFYPPQSSLEANSRKKKVYEQQENEENPLRCPVKLYEFYLSKCPESVKTRNDVFYLQPERSCVPDSPVWYSTQALSREALSKMLHRVKMVKEINIALLTS